MQLAHKQSIASGSAVIKCRALRSTENLFTVSVNKPFYSTARKSSPCSSIISRTRPPPRATQVSGSSAIITGNPVSSIIRRSISRSSEPPPVKISLPDGTSVMSDSGDADRMLSAFFARNVTLAKAAPDDFTIDQYHPDVEGADPGGNRDTVVAAKLGSALFAELGMDSPVAVGSFFDVFPMSVVTTSTLSHLNELQPESRFDLRRFRMNVVIKTERPGFVENDWVGHELGLGDGVQLDVALPDPRCVMTTLAQDELPNDIDILRTLVRHNKIEVGDLGQFPCVGVYAVVGTQGSIQSGDPVVLN